MEKGTTAPQMGGDYSRNDSGEKIHNDGYEITTMVDGEVVENTDQLHRRLGNRQIQLIAIGGSIGTALFVSIGNGLAQGGPGNLFLAYAIYACMLGFVNNGIAEMTTLYPVSGGFIRLGGHFVDEAWGFASGWNFYIYEALLIPFEITALTTILGYWTAGNQAGTDALKWAVPLACIILYGLINVLAVKAYGEAEFWLSGGKVILIFLLFFFTFITMVGGNPQHYAYGFYYWQNPGSFAEWRSTGSLGRFEGFLACLWNASFCVVGPEYISMVAAEAKRPRIYIKNAFKTVYLRFAIFFIGGALAVGIVCAYNDPGLVEVWFGTGTGAGTAAASPYVIAMTNLGITGLPHFVNALLVTSIFSAGNTYTYAATRSLYGLALDGRAPRVLRYCNKSGIPVVCFGITMVFPFLSLLQLSSGSNIVLGWLINLVTAGGVLNYISMSVTFIFYYKATLAQGLDRRSLPYYGYFQPYSAYIGLGWMIFIVCTYGYSSYNSGSVTAGYTGFSVQNWFIYYAMLIVFPILFVVWKVVHRTSFKNPATTDLVWERPTIDAYEDTFIDPPTGFWREIIQLIGINRHKYGNDQRRASVVAAEDAAIAARKAKN